MAKSKKKAQQSQGSIILFGFLGAIVIGFYFWGTVQVDIILRKTEDLKEDKTQLQSKVDALRVQVNKEKSYQQIVERAEAQDLGFISASRLKDLPVDYHELFQEQEERIYPVQYAGISLKGGKNISIQYARENEELK